MILPNKASIKKLSDVNFKRMVAGVKKRESEEFIISQEDVEKAVQAYLKAGGKITNCTVPEERTSFGPSEVDKFLLGV